MMGFVGTLVQKAETKPRFRRMLDSLLSDPNVRSTLLHRIGGQAIHDDIGLDEAMPPDIGSLEHLEDISWLFSSNYANRGVSQMMFDEASWLMKLLRSMEAPTVAEVGRAKGGTTFLMAVAGATVLSLDDESFERGRDRRRSTPSGFRDSIQRALERAGLADRVELVSGDARSYTTSDNRFDLIYLDVALDAAGMDKVFANWWPALKRGGVMILRDGAEPRVPGAQAVAASLAGLEGATVKTDTPGRFVVATRGSRNSESPASVTPLRPRTTMPTRRGDAPVA